MALATSQFPKPNGQGDLKKQSIKVYKKLTERVEPMKKKTGRFHVLHEFCFLMDQLF